LIVRPIPVNRRLGFNCEPVKGKLIFPFIIL